jgi:hypothetical protein
VLAGLIQLRPVIAYHERPSRFGLQPQKHSHVPRHV